MNQAAVRSRELGDVDHGLGGGEILQVCGRLAEEEVPAVG